MIQNLTELPFMNYGFFSVWKIWECLLNLSFQFRQGVVLNQVKMTSNDLEMNSYLIALFVFFTKVDISME